MEPEAPSYKASAVVLSPGPPAPGLPESQRGHPSSQFPQGHLLGVHLVLGTQRKQTQSLPRTPWCDLGGP